MHPAGPKPAYRSDEWIAERRSYLGASEFAVALGLAPAGWGDPISLWEEKRGEGVPREESFRMKLGSLAEPIIGKLASEALGVKLHRVTGPIRHPVYEFLASNPDFRIVGARGLVQAKFRLDGHPFGTPSDDGLGQSIPLHYRIQGLGELLTTGLDFVYFAVLDPFAGLSLHLLDRRADGVEEEIRDLMLDLVDWWQAYMIEGQMPVASAGSSEVLARHYPKRPDAKIGKVASAGQEETLQKLLDLREAKASLEADEEETKNRIKQMIGDAAFIEGAGHRFSWGETHRVDWKLVAKAYRTLLEELMKLDGVADHVAKFTPDLDTIEGLYTRDTRGPFTVAQVK